MSDRHDYLQHLRARGAIATKLAIVVALSAGVLWTAPFSSRAPGVQTPDDEAVPAGRSEAALPALGQAPEPSAAGQPAGDPFAGVDIGSNPVLRYVAGIVEPTRPEAAVETQARPAPAHASTTQKTKAVAERTVTPPTQIPTAPGSSAADVTAATPVNRASDAPPSVAAPVTVVAPPPAAAPPVATPPTAQAPAQAPAKQTTEADQRAAASAPVVAPPVDSARVAMARIDAPPASPPAVTPPRAIRRTVPTFPGEAIKAGIKSGRVLARVAIDADGRVTDSQIVSARPPGYFERESQRALTSWRYEATGRPASTEVELLFSRD
jgi:TonB family protein